MLRRACMVVLLIASAAAQAAPAPALNASRVIDASAAGAVVAATCGRGTADEHRRNAYAAARGMLAQRKALPKDFDARFLRAWSADARRMKALTPAQRKQVCRKLEAQGMRFRH